MFLYDVIIIGGGPAGLTAALYTLRAQLKTLLIENPTLSTQVFLTDKIENYPGFFFNITGGELIRRIKMQVLKYKPELISKEVTGIQRYAEQNFKIWQINTEDTVYNSWGIIIATGRKAKKLKIPQEEKFLGKGISYCAICDGPFFKNKNIVVIGGGDSAVKEALFLTKFGKKIILIHRKDKLRSTGILQEKLFTHKKIQVILNSIVISVLGKEKVETIKIKNIKTFQEENIHCDGIFISIGSIPNTEFINNIVEMDKEGYILTNENMETSQEGIFAVGDCRKKILYQIITACSDGAIAAFSTEKYLEKSKKF